MSGDNFFSTRTSRKVTRIRRLVNRYDQRALSILSKTTDKYSMSVSAKIRAADVFSIDRSGLSDDLYSYALSAHFDFIITFDHKPVMSVELDGPGHLSHRSIENDIKKNELCNFFGLPLLRADTQYLRDLGDSTILEFVIDEILKLIRIDQSSTSLPFFSYDQESIPKAVSETFLPYDVKHFRFSPKSFLDTIFRSQKASLNYPTTTPSSSIFSADGTYFATRLTLSRDNFFTAAALVTIDDDTAILGVGSVYKSNKIPIDAAFFAVAFALIDALDLIRMFDESRYAGLDIQHASEFLQHFNHYASEEGTGRFLSLNPLCQELTADWLRKSD